MVWHLSQIFLQPKDTKEKLNSMEELPFTNLYLFSSSMLRRPKNTMSRRWRDSSIAKA